MILLIHKPVNFWKITALTPIAIRHSPISPVRLDWSSPGPLKLGDLPREQWNEFGTPSKLSLRARLRAFEHKRFEVEADRSRAVWTCLTGAHLCHIRSEPERGWVRLDEHALYLGRLLSQILRKKTCTTIAKLTRSKKCTVKSHTFSMFFKATHS